MPKWNVSTALIPSKSVVDTDDEKVHYWKSLMEAWCIHGKRATSDTFFPGCHPRSMSRSNLASLASHPYSVTYKSDGIRYILYLTMRLNSSPPAAVALMINRSRQMYEVEVVAPEDYFVKGSIFEGELVWVQPDEKCMSYLVFDAIMVKGEPFLSKPFHERMAAAAECTRWSQEVCSLEEGVEGRAAELDAVIMTQFEPRILMQPKCFVDVCNASDLWKKRTQAGHRVDGLVLMRKNAPYMIGTASDQCYKWKVDVTIDLKGTNATAADGPLPSNICGREVTFSTQSRIVPEHEDDIIEYLVRLQGEGSLELFAMRRRIDKSTPNGLCVVDATVRDLIEAMDVDELSKASPAMSKT
jgi:hypothetical protein